MIMRYPHFAAQCGDLTQTMFVRRVAGVAMAGQRRFAAKGRGGKAGAKGSAGASASAGLTMNVFTVEKAGMDGYDKALQAEIIAKLSKGSAFQDKARRKEADVEKATKATKKDVAKLSAKAIAEAQVRADEIVEAARAHLDAAGEQWWALVDMDMFYAAVEQQRRPELADKPFVVGSKSMVTTANYVARKYGIRSAMPGYMAAELARAQGGDLVFVPRDHPLYMKVSAKIVKALKKFTKAVDPRSLDEVSLDLTAEVARRWRERQAKTKTKTKKQAARAASPADIAAALVEEIREHVKAATGGLTCSAGVGANPMLAKLGADVNKPNGQHLTPRDRAAVAAWLGPMSVRKLPGVGVVTQRVLEDGYDIHTVNDLLAKRGVLAAGMRSKQKTLEALLTHAVGACLPNATAAAAKGGKKAPRTFGAERTFYANLAEEVSFLKAVRKICRLAHETVPKKYTSKIRGLTLKIKGQDFDVVTKQHTHAKGEEAMNLDAIIAEAERMAVEISPGPVRLIGVRLNITEPTAAKEKKGRSSGGGDASKGGASRKK